MAKLSKMPVQKPFKVKPFKIGKQHLLAPMRMPKIGLAKIQKIKI